MIELLLAVSLVTKGTIYFAEKDCAPTTGSTFEIKPGDVARHFIWTSGDGENVVLDDVPAKATSLDLGAKEPATSRGFPPNVPPARAGARRARPRRANRRSSAAELAQVPGNEFLDSPCWAVLPFHPFPQGRCVVVFD
jgi:hypothetical protein